MRKENKIGFHAYAFEEQETRHFFAEP